MCERAERANLCLSEFRLGWVWGHWQPTQRSPHDQKELAVSPSDDCSMWIGARLRPLSSLPILKLRLRLLGMFQKERKSSDFWTHPSPMGTANMPLASPNPKNPAMETWTLEISRFGGGYLASKCVEMPPPNSHISTTGTLSTCQQSGVGESGGPIVAWIFNLLGQ